jgi:Tfp pilus assembly protein PilF
MTHLSPLLLLLLASSWTPALQPDNCWLLKQHDRQREAVTCFKELLSSNDAANRAEGYWGLQDWDRSNEQFRLAVQTSASAAEAKVRWGMLLHERFNNKEAADLFREALAMDPSNADAYIGLALISMEDFDGNAMAYVNKVLSLEPNNVKAHELAASLALDNDEPRQAAAQADKAIALDHDAVDAMAVRAALEVVSDRSPDAWINQIRTINPHYGRAYSEIAHHLELRYRHEDAATYYRKAIAAEPALWSAHSSLGIALMRLGEQEEAQKELELSYDNGYRNAATVNSLRLLDSYRNYVTVQDGDTILKLKKTESELLRPYLQAELHTIVATYNRKYAMTLPGPIQLEVYPDHEDFAVRTTGMPGLGALGVTFGEVIAIDSPSARRPGDFNWGATLWHEMSHAYVLFATHDHVSRWFTEGLAVHEEGEHVTEWKNRATPDVLIAIRDKKLLPILQLDRGFVFPQYPSQVIVSYFQAGTICDFIKEEWGESTLLAMIHSYAARHTTSEVIQQVLKTTPENFDQQYLAWIEKHYGPEASQFAHWQQQIKSLLIAAQNKEWDTVARVGPAVIALYPDYVGEDNAYELLAEGYHASQNPASEAAILAAYAQAGGQNPASLKRLAALQESRKDPAAAANTLTRINYIYPVNDPDLHQKLGGLFYQQKKFDESVREYSAALASNPVDKAGVQYQLARSYLATGNRRNAEESVLAALEIAPSYIPAQQLLLELHPSSGK